MEAKQKKPAKTSKGDDEELKKNKETLRNLRSKFLSQNMAPLQKDNKSDDPFVDLYKKKKKQSTVTKRSLKQLQEDDESLKSSPKKQQSVIAVLLLLLFVAQVFEVVLVEFLEGGQEKTVTKFVASEDMESAINTVALQYNRDLASFKFVRISKQCSFG
ncbi:hypothetical protein RFI_27773 [Reticulomyxa filosa]|uniref:Uncharacterized protein n=1 Tax=Reticulomyxa filosa TaxID=46433 RepID=X6M6I4_RETFI|nr:hypothetical protein RFI_27773 [Reticulomyxa filosa]|eukprot:ETO09603.1 hypothetical protein RFI_27773 [Reticulomyxa filosa]